MHKRSIWTLVASFALLTLPLAMGCGDDDKSGGTGPTPNQNVPEDVALDQAEGAVDFANNLISSVNDLAQLSSEDDFSGLGGGFLLFKRAAEPVETTVYAGGQWTHTYTEEVSEGGFSAALAFLATLQFRDGENAPQQFPDEDTNSMSYGIDADLEFGSSFQDEEGTTTISTDIDYSADLDVTGFLESALEVLGTGTQRIGLVSTGSEGNFNFLLEMAWDIDVLVPQNGACPTGTIDIAFGQYSITVTYPGTDQPSWVLRDGSSTIGSGTGFISCGVPVGTQD